MSQTSTSLLLRLRDPGDQDAWREFERNYREMLLRYCQRRGLQETDAQDVVQTMFLDLSQSLRSFLLDRSRGRFRDYLFRCAQNAIHRCRRSHARRPMELDSQLVNAIASTEPDPAQASAFQDEWVAHHYRLAMGSVRLQFDSRSVRIFERCVAGADVQSIAEEFGTNRDSIYKLRQRIRVRLEELVREQVRAEEELDGSLRG